MTEPAHPNPKGGKPSPWWLLLCLLSFALIAAGAFLITYANAPWLGTLVCGVGVAGVLLYFLHG